MSLLHNQAGMTAALNRMADNEVRDSNQEETNENFDNVNTQLATMRKEMTERDAKEEVLLQACQTLTTTVKKLQESQSLKEEDKEEVTANLFDETAPLPANKIPHNDEEEETVLRQTTAAPIVQGGARNVSSSIDCVDSKAPLEIDAKETQQSTSKKIRVQTTPFNKTNLQQARPSGQVKIQAPPASANRGGVKRSLTTNMQTPISKRSRRGTHAESAHIDRRRKGLELETDKTKSRTMNVKNETSYQRTYATRSSSKKKP